jgi:signal transduction histidine kinase
MSRRAAINPGAIAKLLPRKILSITVLKWTFPLSIFLAVATTPKSISSGSEIFIWIFIGATAHLAMFPFVYYGREKAFGEQILLVFLMGFVRGALISVLAPLFEVHDLLTPAERIANSMIAVFYWSQAGAIIVEYGIEFRRKVRELLNEILEKNIGGLPEAAKKSSNAIVEIIGHLQEQIVETVGNAPTKEGLARATHQIDHLINEHIKPLSQSQWKDGEFTWMRAGFPRVLKRTLSLNPIPVVAVIVLTFPFTLVAQISSIGLLQTLLIQLVWNSCTLTLVWALYRNRDQIDNYLGRNLIFLLVLPVAYAITFWVQLNSPFDLSQSRGDMYRGYLMSIATQIAAYLVGSLLLALRSDQEFVFEFISDVIKAGELEKLLARTKSGNLDVNYAQYLHAEVQSQLLACKLLLLKAAETDFQLFPPEVTKQILDRMEKIKQPYQKPAARIPAKRLEELKASWTGLSEITFDLESELSELHSYSDVVSQLIEEAVVNSIRHGKATSINVTSRADNSEIEIAIIDNGIGTIGNTGSGLGTILFDTFSSRWNLEKVNDRTTLTFAVERRAE